jgi:hypothetical protein
VLKSKGESYLDLCAIQRPLDTANQVRIALEAEAVLGIIRFLDSAQVELLSSEALLYEGEQSGLPIRREHTRDDKLLQHSKRVPDLMVKVANPVELVQEMEK